MPPGIPVAVFDLVIQRAVSAGVGTGKGRQEIDDSDLVLELVDVYNHRSTINIFDEMERIKKLLSGQKEATFREISSVYGRVIDRIVSFLSVLELYKNEEIEIVQFESFGNIVIRFK